MTHCLVPSALGQASQQTLVALAFFTFPVLYHVAGLWRIFRRVGLRVAGGLEV